MPVTLAETRALDLTLREGGIRSVFQPVVDVATRAVVGYEALSRGAAGSPLATPTRLLAAARAAGMLAEADWSCRCAAFEAALRSGLRPPLRLFVNAEPEALDTACPAVHMPTLVAAHRALSVVVEVTERHLLHDLPGLLRVVATLRELGWEVALDDVGAEPSSLLLLPVVRPDIVKLDAGLLRGGARERATVDTVRRYAETAGAVVLAEGVETEADLEQAVALGATWLQGWLLGRPGPLPAEPGLGLSVVPPGVPGAVPSAAPGAAAPARRAARRAAAEADPEIVRHGPSGPTPCRLVAGSARARRTTPAGMADAVVDLLQRPTTGPSLVVVAPGALGLPAALLGALQQRSPADEVRVLATAVPALPGPLVPVELRDPALRECAAVVVGQDGSRAVVGRPGRAGRWMLTGPVEEGPAVAVAQALLARS